ncbi:hypothetical protein M0812_23787 [Anaeramoeba flamelloides]|uniref:Uncharacterized protein n=1 Tax=Anaeramoeba flamelloides TaxID=1746091 RepID=A0AAV7YIG3_9EUKA|nr:hypothetical protein M0812_23787 [Anaeramoeba flamelloides]
MCTKLELGNPNKTKFSQIFPFEKKKNTLTDRSNQQKKCFQNHILQELCNLKFRLHLLSNQFGIDLSHLEKKKTSEKTVLKKNNSTRNKNPNIKVNNKINTKTTPKTKTNTTPNISAITNNVSRKRKKSNQFSTKEGSIIQLDNLNDQIKKEQKKNVLLENEISNMKKKDSLIQDQNKQLKKQIIELQLKFQIQLQEQLKQEKQNNINCPITFSLLNKILNS